MQGIAGKYLYNMLRNFTTLPVMFLHQQTDVQSWVDKAVETNNNILVAYIFVHLTYMYGNWQRPSVAINLTLTEARSAKVVQGKFMVTSCHHKTSGTQGLADLALAGLGWEAFTFYLNTVWQGIPCNSRDDTALLTSTGRALHNHTSLLKSLCRHYKLPVLPSLTMTRKAGAARVMESGATQAEMEKLGTHLFHLPSTLAKYYRVRQRKRTAADMHAVISSGTARGNVNINTTNFN